MQPQDSLTVARRTYDVEDYIDILRRHKGWIFGPVFAGLVIAVVVAFLWPDTYVSTATIRVVPPQVPENFVPTNTNSDIQGRVNSLVQLILNRSTLTAIINTQALYKKERDRLPLDDVIENMMKKDIRVVPIIQSIGTQPGRQQYPAFEIRFSYSNRFIAQKVVTDLVARFLEENIRDVTQAGNATNDFLKDEWDKAKQKLDTIDQRLAVFRSQNMGRLPEETQSNYAQLTSMHAQLGNLNSTMNRINSDKLLIEGQIQIAKSHVQGLKDPAANDTVVQQRNEKLAEKDREITQLEELLRSAKERYTATHPDVQRLTATVAAAKKSREALAKEEESKKPDAPVQRAPSPQFVRELAQYEDEIKKYTNLREARDLELEEAKKEATQLNAAIKNYESRMESVPVGIKEWDALIRDRDLAKKEYEDLDRRKSQSAISTSLNNRQQGERLEQLDQPSLPQTHTDPKRPVIIATGAGIGLVIGLCLAGAREMKDTALKNLKDVRAYTQLPVLGSIPLLENDLVVRRRKRLSWLAWSTACLVGMVIMSGSVVYYYATKI
jgi:succinoglycan biosynthesis transport protein ExoP